MSLKFVLRSMTRRKVRTVVMALALIVGVALVGALLALVDTQRQFSIQSIGAQTGGYDLSISKSDLAATPFFTITDVEASAQAAYDKIAQMHPRIQDNVEARKVGVLDGTSVTFVAIDPEQDALVSVAQPSASNNSRNTVMGIRIGGIGGQTVVRGGPQGGFTGPGPGGGPGQGGGRTNFGSGQFAGRSGARTGGEFPPQPGQIYLDSTTAGVLGARIGDQVELSYAIPSPREVGEAAITGTSSPRIEAVFTVAGVGTLSGLNSDVSNPLVMRLDDAQAWLGETGHASQLLLVWQTGTSGTTDARNTVTQARGVGQQVRSDLQTQLGPNYVVSLPKYTRLENQAQSFQFTEIFITLYGILSMGIVGLMVNALMLTTVVEMKYELAVLRVIGSSRNRLYAIVILEVVILGVVGVVLGLGLGRIINDYLIVPLLLTNLDLPAGVRADWTLETVLIPTAITAVVLALATINPARTAAGTKVMVVLNPAAADQPTLEDLAKLRERRADSGLLIAGLVLLAFSAVVLIVLPTVLTSGNASGTVVVTFGSLLLMVIGIALLFYFFATPLERLLVFLYGLVSPRATFFAGRYAMRGKGRNALISLMVVMSGVLPCLLATQLALQDANLDTDTRFANGAPLIAQTQSGGARFSLFRRSDRADANMSNADVAAVKNQQGINQVIGVADNLPGMTVGDQISLRTARANLVGVDASEADLNQVLYTDLYRWTEGDASAFTRIAHDPDAAIISQGLSQALDLHVGDPLLVQGVGNDHSRLMIIAAVAERLPGFANYFSRNRNDANGSGIFINLNTYRELQNDPSKGPFDPTEPVLTKLFATLQPRVNENLLLVNLRNTLGNQQDMNVSATSEAVTQARAQLEQSRVPIVLLTILSMVTAVFGVLAVMYTAVMGRRVEIGMLKALGASKGLLRGIFIGEALITTLAAGIAGIIAGTILGYAFVVSQRIQTDQPFMLAFDFSTAGVIVALVSVAAIFSAALATQPVIRQKAIRILRERS